jgi:hypothetical protein
MSRVIWFKSHFNKLVNICSPSYGLWGSLLRLVIKALIDRLAPSPCEGRRMLSLHLYSHFADRTVMGQGLKLKVKEEILWAVVRSSEPQHGQISELVTYFVFWWHWSFGDRWPQLEQIWNFHLCCSSHNFSPPNFWVLSPHIWGQEPSERNANPPISTHFWVWKLSTEPRLLMLCYHG